MNTKYMVIVAAMTVMLIGATALATSESAFAGGRRSTERIKQSRKQTTVVTDSCQRMLDAKTLHLKFRPTRT
jgi:hypothetical protein